MVNDSHMHPFKGHSFEAKCTFVVCVFCRTVLYECCPGYMKLEAMPGCPAGTVH